MKQPVLSSSQIRSLHTFFGNKLKKGEILNRYSVMNVGGPADYLVTAESSQDLETFVCFLWEEKIPFLLLGGGSNTLISDAGIRELVLINEAKEIKFLDGDSEHPLLWAESGASFGNLARRAGSKGWSGLEWAPGNKPGIGKAPGGWEGKDGMIRRKKAGCRAMRSNPLVILRLFGARFFFLCSIRNIIFV